MSVWKKLVTAVKGGANEAAEAVADSQAIRILEQEMREAKEELRRSDNALTQLMAKRKLAQQKIASLGESMADYQRHAQAASDKGDRQLALECAQKVVELRGQQESEQQYADTFAASEQSLRANIAAAKANVRRMEQQVDMVKATEAVQKAQVSVSSRHLGANGKMKTAAESLGRIQARQQQRQAELESAAELAEAESGDELEKRLRQAGIVGSNASAEEELAKILGK